MSLMKVNPTRVELKNLTRKLAVAVKGHKMLKDKNDQMVRLYTNQIKKNYMLRKQVEESLKDLFDQFLLAKCYMSESDLNNLFIATKSILHFDTISQMNLALPDESFDLESKVELPYSFVDTNPQLDILALKIQNIVPVLCKLATIEKSCQMLATEIERTKRRVNALEFIMIPDLQETIKYIKLKLEENDRANRIRLIKYKDLCGM